MMKFKNTLFSLFTILILCLSTLPAFAETSPQYSPVVLVVGDTAPASDVINAVKIANELKSDYDIDTGAAKLNSEVGKEDLVDKLTVFVYRENAIIIVDDNAPAEDVMLATKIHEWLRQLGVSAVSKLVSEITSDNLIRNLDIEMFEISAIDGLKNSYNSNEDISLEIKGVEPDGTPGTPSEGFNVQYYISAVDGKTVIGGNAIYDAGYWYADFEAPSDAATYGLGVYFYCSRDEAVCAQTYGIAAQVEENRKFEVGGGEPICTDSDGGRNYYEKGHTIGFDPQSAPGYQHKDVWDICAKDHPDYAGRPEFENKLFEYGCRDGYFYSETYTCPNGCRDGRCYYPGYYLTPDKKSYQEGDIIELKIRAADRGTAKIHLYVIAPDYERILIKESLLVEGERLVEIDTRKYSSIFDSSGVYLLATSDAGDEYIGGVNTNSIFVEFSKSGEVGEGKPDLVIRNLKYIEVRPDLATIDFDIVNIGDEDADDWFAIAVYIDGRFYTHTIYNKQKIGTRYGYDEDAAMPLGPGESYHKSLSNYYWLRTGRHEITIVADRFEGEEEDNPIFENIRDNMIDESDEGNNKASIIIGEVAVRPRLYLAAYPDMFIKDGRFDGYIVVGDKAPASDVVAAVDIANGIARATAPKKIEVGAVKLASEISNPKRFNIISVGNSCANAVTSILKGNPDPCHKGLNEGVGIIQLYEYGTGWQIVVEGYSDLDTRKAAKVLANYKEYNLQGTCLIVLGDFDNPKIKACPTSGYVTPAIPVEVPIVKPEEPLPDLVITPRCEGEGCAVDNTCVYFGVRLVEDKVPSYCDIDGWLKEQKDDGDTCQNNYECLSNTCGNGVCQDFGERLSALEKEMKETKGLLNRIMVWFKRLFGMGLEPEEPEEEQEETEEEVEEEEVPESSSPVIENDFGVLTYDSTSVSNFCDFVEDTSCDFYTARYSFRDKTRITIAAGVEVHSSAFTNQQAIDGMKGEFARGEIETETHTLSGNNIYIFSYGDEGTAVWYSGKNVVAVHLDYNGRLTPEEVDDVFEDSLLKYYLDKYPSDLVFE